MKKALFLIIAAILAGYIAFYLQTKRAVSSDSSDKIDDAHIYFFYQERCGHCHHARDYIKEKYPTLAVEYRDIMIKENLADFMACAKKFNLPEKQLGTPLICMGQNVIMGWGKQDPSRFDAYVKPFYK